MANAPDDEEELFAQILARYLNLKFLLEPTQVT